MTNKSSEREQQVRGIQRIAFAIFGAAMAYEFVSQLIIFISDLYSQNFLAGIATAVITLSVLGLVFLWYESSSREFNYMNRWCSINQVAPSSTLGEVAIAATVALVLAGLIYAVRTPVYFAAIFTAYNIMDTLVQNFVVRRHLSVSLGTSRREIAHDLALADSANDNISRRQLNAHLRAIEGLEAYYFNSAQGKRRLAIAVASIGILTVMLLNSPSSPESANPDEIPVYTALHYRALMAYAVLIIISEIVMHQFRLPLLTTMKEAEKEFKTSSKSSLRRPVASE